jgi:hypothetical protein
MLVPGYNTTLSLQTYEGTIPSLPQLGRALSSIEIELPTPELKFPKNPNHNDDNDENAPRFIDDATVCSKIHACRIFEKLTSM